MRKPVRIEEYFVIISGVMHSLQRGVFTPHRVQKSQKYLSRPPLKKNAPSKAPLPEGAKTNTST